MSRSRAEGPPTSYEERARPSAVALLPTVVWVLVALALGYAAGSIRRDREQTPTAVTAIAPPVPAAGQSGTTGTEVTVAPPAKPSGNSAAAVSKPSGGSGAATGTSAARPKSVATSGRIVVTSTPAKAAVTINGKWSGRTPLTVDDLKFGKYVVRVVQPGYEVARREVALSTASPSGTFDTTLRPSKAPD